MIRGLGIGVGALLVAGLAAGCRDGEAAHPMVPGGDPARGKQHILVYGCGSCHVIPGVNRANGMVGPPLQNFAHRAYIAGQVSNTPANLVRWIEHPQAIEPGTAMPTLGISEGEARDIAAYLYTLR